MSGADGKNKRGEDDLFLAYVVMTIVRWDVFLVQIAIMCHRVPGPSGVPSNSANVVPVVSGTCIVHHGVWVDTAVVNSVTVMHWGITY